MKPVDDDGLILALSDGKVTMGLYPVLYGWRVRAGFSGEQTYELDWCCGDNSLIIWSTYEMMHYLLGKHPIKVLPRSSNVKPWPKDLEFSHRLVSLMAAVASVDPIPMLTVPRPSLTSLREEYYKKNGIMGLGKLFNE